MRRRGFARLQPGSSGGVLEGGFLGLGVDHRTMFVVVETTAHVCHFLAGDTERGPGNSVQTLGTDIFFAMTADAVRAFVKALERAVDLAQQPRIAVDVAYREFAVHLILNLIQLLRDPLDSNVVDVPKGRDQLFPLCAECFFYGSGL